VFEPCWGRVCWSAAPRRGSASLSAAPGAAGALLALTRSEDDGDCQQIAVGVFGELGKSGDPAVRAAGVEAVHEAEAAAAAAAR
jgi:hypothetical protein